MPLLHAIILGITQGLSEFLPISSSGHLQLVPWLFGWDDFAADPQLETTFDVALHIGTLAGAVAYFRADLVRLAVAGFGVLRPRRRRAGAPTTGEEQIPADSEDQGGASALSEDQGGASAVRVGQEGDRAVRPEWGERAGLPTVPEQQEGAVSETGVELAPGPAAAERDARLAWLLVLSAVPAGVTGVLFEDTFARIGETEWLIGVLLIVFGLVLLVADRLGGTREADRFTVRDALVMGVAQAAALQPGVSRSGVTITAARGLGFQRDAAARLSFLMSLPIIGGAGAYKGFDVVTGTGIPPAFLPAFAVGMVAAGVTGFAAVWATLRLVRTRTFTPFVVYRCAIGAGVILLVVSGIR